MHMIFREYIFFSTFYYRNENSDKESDPICGYRAKLRKKAAPYFLYQGVAGVDTFVIATAVYDIHI